MRRHFPAVFNLSDFEKNHNSSGDSCRPSKSYQQYAWIVLVLGLVDVLNGSTIPCADTYSYVEGYVAAAIIYWAINAVVEFFLVRLEKHFSKKR